MCWGFLGMVLGAKTIGVLAPNTFELCCFLSFQMLWFVWICLHLFGCVWICLALFGFVWICLHLFGFVWTCRPKLQIILSRSQSQSITECFSASVCELVARCLFHSHIHAMLAIFFFGLSSSPSVVLPGMRLLPAYETTVRFAFRRSYATMVRFAFRRLERIHPSCIMFHSSPTYVRECTCWCRCIR
jgi:hypothetical protein